MLLANKAERGKRKIADRWESTVYTVVDCKPQTHTYRIQNPTTGQEKVVHRNLLLLVNFLPVPERISAASQVSTMSNSHSDMPSGLSARQQGSLLLMSKASAAPMDVDIVCKNVFLTRSVNDDTERTLNRGFSLS